MLTTPATRREALRPVKGKRFRPDIEGLRAVAVVAVLLNHLFGWPGGGFVGVDVFFVISGFLITGLLVREREKTGRIAFRSFYARRIRRILPLATIVIIVTLAATFLTEFLPTAATASMDAASSLLFVENWHLVRTGTDYLAASTTPSPFQHFWSLSVEEQYYVIWPIVIVLVVAVAGRFARPRSEFATRLVLSAILCLAVGGSLVFSVWDTHHNSAQAYFSTFTRVWELGFGALLAVAPIPWDLLTRQWRTYLASIGFILLIVSVFFFSSATPFPSGYAVVPVLGTVALIAAGTGGRHALDFALSNRVAGWIGARSYSLYLWHFPAVIILLAVFPDKPLVYYLVVLAVSLAATMFFYRFVELPIHHSHWLDGWAKRRTGRLSNIAVPVVVGAVLVALAAGQLRGPDWVISPPIPQPSASASQLSQTELTRDISASLNTKSWPTGLSPSMNQLSGDSRASALGSHGCLNDVSATRPVECRYGSPDATRTALVLGDSVAMSWLPTINAALIHKGWKVIGLGFASCPIVNVSAQQRLALASFLTDCEQSRERAYALEQSLSPDLTFIAGTEDALGRLSSGNTGMAAVNEWTSGTLSTVNTLAPHTGRLVLLSNPPSGADPADCAVPFASPQRCTSQIGQLWEEKYTAESAAASESGLGNVSAVDVSSWFCTSTGHCPIIVGGTPVRADSVHLTAEYGKRLGTVLDTALGI